MPVAAPALQPSAPSSQTNGLNPLRTIAQRRVAQWKEPGKTPTERRKRRMSLHCGLFNALAAVIELLAQGREFVSLLLDYSEGREKIDVFDDELVEDLTIKEHLSKEAAKKRIQRGRAALNQAQDPKKGNTIIALGSGYKNLHPDGHEEKKSCVYDLTNVWGVLSLAQSIAQPELKLTTNRPRLLQAAIEVALKEFPWMAPLRRRKRKRDLSRAERDELNRTRLQKLACRVDESTEGTDEERRNEVLRLVTEALDRQDDEEDDFFQGDKEPHPSASAPKKSSPPRSPLFEPDFEPEESRLDEASDQQAQDKLSLTVSEDKGLNPGLVSQPSDPEPAPEAVKPPSPAPPQTIGQT